MRGFSLVELSIVLVILGLLTGGILAGQSLIRASELRAVTAEYQRYVTAVQTFRDKYFAIPGDMNNATKFWGTAAGCPNGGGTGTCDGDGNGQIYIGQEMYRFWQHMALAGIIEGTYSPLATPDNVTNPTPGVNVPRSKLSNGFWTTAYLSQLDATNYEFGYSGVPDVRNQYLIISKPQTGWWAAGTNGAILKAEEAWNIDTKMDDGMPAVGKVRGGVANACTPGTTVATTYALNTSTISCSLAFIYN